MSSAHDWTYLAEGGANVVFRYVGSPRPPCSGHVLRLRKASSKESGSGPDLATEAIFRQDVIKPLLGEQYLPDCKVIDLERAFLEELGREAERGRPAWRKDSAGLDLEARHGLLVSDLTHRRGQEENLLMVEIKPKWGFLPLDQHLSPSAHHLKSTYCRTCMHRQLKLSSARSATTSSSPPSSADYCPLDLYSGDERRMRRAIGELWKGWEDGRGEGNSLRLFVNGELLQSEDTSLLLDALDLSSGKDLGEAMAEVLVPALSRSRLLPHLARLQASLDPLDVKGLFTLSLLQNPTKSVTSPSLDDFSRFARLYVGQQLEWTDKDHLLAFLLSATFKDCSVVARINLPSSKAATTVTSEVKVIDLDPKPAERLQKWKRLDEDIVKHFQEFLEREGEDHVRKCVEGQ